MAAKLDADMPDDVTAGGAWRFRWRAVDPTTGADVAGVVVSDVNVDGDAIGSDSGVPSVNVSQLLLRRAATGQAA